jgi:hypothetical protein
MHNAPPVSLNNVPQIIAFAQIKFHATNAATARYLDYRFTNAIIGR